MQSSPDVQFRYLFGKGELEFLTHFKNGPLPFPDQFLVLGQGRDQDRHGDRRIAVTRHHTGIMSNFAPALGFFKGAAGEPAPLGHIGNHLDSVFVTV